MDSDIGGTLLFWVLLLTSLGVGFVVLQDLSAKPCPWRRRLVASVALFLVTAGMALTLSPTTATTGQGRTAVAVTLVLLGSVGYAIVRRPIVREPVSVTVDASGR